MELVKENVHESKIKNKTTVQFTLDDDFNVSDSLPDIEKIVKERGRLHIESVRLNNEKAEVAGSLEFALMYMADMPVAMKKQMDFRESINLSDIKGDEEASCYGEIEDLTIKTINSRKISVKAIISLTVTCEQLEDTGLVMGIDGHDDDVQILKRDMEYARLQVKMKDTFRIRESIQLPAGKPNVAEILWSDVSIKTMDTRLTDEGLAVNGEASMFVMYKGVDENESLNWMDTVFPFQGVMDTSGTNPDMIVYVKYGIQSCEIEVKPDYDGEDREISVEMVLDMDIKAYEERNASIVEDMYSPTKDMVMKTCPSDLKKLMVRNNSKCRVNQRIKVNPAQKVLQICNCTGNAKVDDVTLTDEGIEVDGVIMVNVFFVTSDDHMPLGSVKDSIPFNHKIQHKVSMDDFSEKDFEYSINVNLEQLVSAMTGTDEIDIKAVVALDTICFTRVSREIIEDVEIQPFDDSQFFKLPSIVGYIADGRDTLWDVAKRYHTTMDSIKCSNKMSGEKLNKGDKLILVKSMK